MQPRFRLRTLILGVAAVAIFFGAERTRQRWNYYRQQAALHDGHRLHSERIERWLKAILMVDDSMTSGRGCGTALGRLKEIRSWATSEATKAAHHARLSEQYRRRW